MLTLALATIALGLSQEIAVQPNFWAREEAAGSCVAEGRGLRIEHRGKLDWSVNLGERIPVTPGQVLSMKAQIQMEGAGQASLSFVLRKGDEVVAWAAGQRSLTGKPTSQTNTAAVLIAPGVTSAQPRLVGSGPATLSVGPITLGSRRVGLLPAEQAQPRILENPLLRLTLNPRTLRLDILDKRIRRTWSLVPAASGSTAAAEFSDVMNTLRVRTRGSAIELEGLRAEGAVPISLRLALDPKRAEFTWTANGRGDLSSDLDLPGPVQATRTSEHIVPMNMGMVMPAADPAIEDFWLSGFGGHGICMAFFGTLDRGAGVLTMIDRTDDFLLKIGRRDGLAEARPSWRGEKGQFGYARGLRMVVFDRADHNTFALRYREEAKRRGLLVPLTEKAKRNPNVARVARSANLWSWGPAVPLAEAAHQAGFRDVLWSGGGKPAELRRIRELGFVTSRYDIYQDVLDPAQFPNISGVHPDWTTAAWPDKLVRDANGEWVRGWGIKDKQGRDLFCAVCCDREAISFARERIAKELKDHPYEARFIDTTTASDYRECYDPRHPMTRSESREARMKLLQLVTDFGLVTGSETGHEAAVPHLVFFEGMMSLGPYRVDDSGTDPPRILTSLPERVRTFQLGPKYRLPLWQLVYGDCTVSTWYWGDFNNKHAETWPIRDRWNQLYGTPPMYFTDADAFRKGLSEFKRSYQEIIPLLRETAMKRMLRHDLLTADRTVQRTRWEGGLEVTVNFGSQSFDGIAPGGIRTRRGR